MNETSFPDNLPARRSVVLEDAHVAMHAGPYAQTLLALLEAVLQGSLAVPAFCEAFGDYYVEQQPDPGISLAQAELFLHVQQKIDWTDADPSPKARQNGWQDHAQLLRWLQQRVGI